MSALLLIAFLAQADSAGDLARLAADLESKAAEAGLLGKYADAERQQKRALALWEDVARTRPVNLAPPHVNLAQIYVAQNKLRDAERESRQAITLSTPEDLPRVTGLLAKVLFLAGDYKEAEKALRTSIANLERNATVSRTELAAAMNDLGMVLFKKGDYREARDWMEKSEEAYRLDGHTNGADFGRVLSNLAMICLRQGDYAGAEQRYLEALSILEAALGPEHPHVGIILSERAAVVRKLGRKSEANAISRRARAILISSPDLPGRHTIDIGALR